jgi:hypothetical protein
MGLPQHTRSDIFEYLLDLLPITAEVDIKNCISLAVSYKAYIHHPSVVLLSYSTKNYGFIQDIIPLFLKYNLYHVLTVDSSQTSPSGKHPWNPPSYHFTLHLGATECLQTLNLLSSTFSAHANHGNIFGPSLAIFMTLFCVNSLWNYGPFKARRWNRIASAQTFSRTCSSTLPQSVPKHPCTAMPGGKLW